MQITMAKYPPIPLFLTL